VVNNLIYIIDDEADVAQTLGDFLDATYDCETKSFLSLDECLKDLDSGKKPAIILSDVFMITGSGLRLKDEINKRSLEIPAIYITGMMDKIPADDDLIMLKKPVNFNELKSWISKLTNLNIKS
jgi:FixJ family two-component response regulator